MDTGTGICCCRTSVATPDARLARADALSAMLAEPRRLRLLLRLREEQTVGDLVCARSGRSCGCGCSPSLTSYHLRALREAGLVWVRREGRTATYGLTEETRRVLDALVGPPDAT